MHISFNWKTHQKHSSKHSPEAKMYQFLHACKAISSHVVLATCSQKSPSQSLMFQSVTYCYVLFIYTFVWLLFRFPSICAGPESQVPFTWHLSRCRIEWLLFCLLGELSTALAGGEESLLLLALTAIGRGQTQSNWKLDWVQHRGMQQGREKLKQNLTAT